MLGLRFLFGLFLACNITPADAKPIGDIAFVETISDNILCGRDLSGDPQCIDYLKNKLRLPDLFSSIQNPVSNNSFGCAKDQGEVKCWSSIDGIDYLSDLETLEFDSVKVGPSRFCGFEKGKADKIRCFYGVGHKSVLIELGFDAVQFDVAASADFLCASSATEIKCFNFSDKVPIRKFNFLDAHKLVVGQKNWVCARGTNGSQCFTISSNAVWNVGSDFSKSDQWLTNGRDLCALLPDGAIDCRNPTDGSQVSLSGLRIPTQFGSPNSGIIKVWGTSNSDFCWTSSQGSANEATCTSWYRNTTYKFKSDIKQIFGAGYKPCFLLTNQTVECPTSLTASTISFSSGDHLKVVAGNTLRSTIFWNQSGVIGIDRPNTLEQISAFSQVGYSDHCFAGVSKLGTRAIECSNSYYVKQFPKYSENEKILGMSMSSDYYNKYSCLISDSNLRCEGKLVNADYSLFGIFEPKKIQTVRAQTCLLDKFGLLCFGSPLTFMKSVPPEVFNHPNVIDFAMSDNALCIVNLDETISCYADRSYGFTPPPQLEGVKSIAVNSNGSGSFCAIGKFTNLKGVAEVGPICWGKYSRLTEAFKRN